MELYKINCETLTYNFHSAQWLAWMSQSRTTALLAGTQSGKTAFGPTWLHNEIIRANGGDHLAVTTNFSLFQKKLLPELRYLFEDVLKIGRYHRAARILEIQDPTTGKFWARYADDRMYGRIMLGSAEAPAQLESTTAKSVWLDECGQDEWKIEHYEAIDRRLSLSQGRKLLTTTLYNLDWLIQQVLKPTTATGRQKTIKDARGGEIVLTVSEQTKTTIIQYDSIVNPIFPLDEYEEKKRTMRPDKFAFFYRGRIEQPPGLIYSNFKHDTHIIRPRPIDPDWQQYLFFDFGKPNIAIIVAHFDTAENTLYLTAEYCPTEKATISEHISNIAKLDATKANLKQLEQQIAIGGQWSEDNWRDEFTAAGITIHKPPIKSIDVGIERVYSRIAINGLIIFNTLGGTITEIGSYAYKIAPNGDILPEIHNKSKFHRMDALRYGIAHIDHTTSADTAEQGDHSWVKMPESPTNVTYSKYS